MRIVVALGGNALLRPGEPMTAARQRENVRSAARSLAPIAEEHDLVITHGNGPQVGMLAAQAAAHFVGEPFPLDVLGAQTEGMIGYLIEQELGNLIPVERPFATVLTMVEVDPDDPAFENPTKPIGPYCAESEARRLEARHGWSFQQFEDGWRRVVPSPNPRHIFEIRPIRWLLEKHTIVVCTGGGGIPTVYGEEGTLQGVDVVIDKDRTSALLADELGADFLVMATDVDGVYRDWGTDEATRIGRTTPSELRSYEFPAGSMGPKVEAACAYVDRGAGRSAAIGSLDQLQEMVAGDSGTLIQPDE